MTTERYLLFASPKVCTIRVVFQAVFIKNGRVTFESLKVLQRYLEFEE